MKLFSRLLPIVTASLLFCGGAQAFNEPTEGVLPGGYMSVTYSQGDIANFSDRSGLGLKPALEDAGAKLTLGYKLAEGVNLEAALSNMKYSPQSGGGVDYATVIATQTSSLSTMFYAPATAGVVPFVKLGMASVAVGYGQESTTTSVAAVGVVFPLSDSLNARFEIERLDRFGSNGRDFTQAFVGLQVRL